MKTQSLHGLFSHSPIHASLDSCFWRAKCQAQPRDPLPLPHSVQGGGQTVSARLGVTVGWEGLHAEGARLSSSRPPLGPDRSLLVCFLTYIYLLHGIKVAEMQKRALPRRGKLNETWCSEIRPFSSPLWASFPLHHAELFVKTHLLSSVPAP